MAIVFTELTGGSTTADASTLVTASIAVTINVPVILLIGNTLGSAPATTCTATDDAAGGTNTYTSVRTRGFNGGASPLKKVQLLSMVPKATESIVITVAFASVTQTGLFHSVINCAGANPIGTVVQSVGAFNDAVALNFNAQMTLATFGAAGNMGLSIVGHAANEVTTKDASGTLIRNGNFGTPTAGFLTQYHDNSVLSPTASWSSSSSSGGIALEIAAAAAGGAKGPLVNQGIVRRLVNGGLVG